MTLDTLFSSPPLVKNPWPRHAVTVDQWNALAESFTKGTFAFLGLWADEGCVHLAVMEKTTHAIAVATLAVPDGRYPSIAARHLPALRMERTISDMYGFVAQGCPDTRPWFDHGHWPVVRPLGQSKAEQNKAAYEFLPVEGQGIHEIPVGPIHAGIIEPGHFRFSANGETIVRLEERLGYTHKGTEKLLQGAEIAHGAKLLGRVSGDSTVAYAYAYALAAENALGITIPPRAVYLRAFMAELERIANHLWDIGMICNDAAFALLHTHFGILREELLRLCQNCFGHRMMMDCVIPGGVTVDLDSEKARQINEWIAALETRMHKLNETYDDTASLRDRTNRTGTVSNELVELFAAGGFVGRASNRHFDTRKHVPYAPYDTLAFETAWHQAGDVHARIWVRRFEIQQSITLLRQLLKQMPQGAISVSLPDFAQAAEGMAMVESFRGDVFVWLRLGADGKIARCWPRDPSWFQWPLLEVAIKGNIVGDFPLCNKSFNCSYSGQDL